MKNCELPECEFEPAFTPTFEEGDSLEKWCELTESKQPFMVLGDVASKVRALIEENKHLKEILGINKDNEKSSIFVELIKSLNCARRCAVTVGMDIHFWSDIDHLISVARENYKSHENEAK